MRFRREIPRVDRAHGRPAHHHALAVDAPADDVRIHAGAADVLADGIDDEDVHFRKRQRGHPRARLLQQRRLLTRNLVAAQHRHACEPVRAILDQAHAIHARQAAEHRGRHLGQCRLVPEPRCPVVTRRGSLDLPQSDRGHLQEAAAERGALEVRVRLDAVHEHHGVGVARHARQVDGHAADRAPHVVRIHLGTDGYTECFARDAVGREQFALPIWCGATMTAHGRNDEWLRAVSAEPRDERPGNDCDLINSAAAERDPHAAAPPVVSPDARELLNQRGGRIIERVPLEPLPETYLPW
jgi:hypothetical protein